MSGDPSGDDPERIAFVLTGEAVRASIDRLQSMRIDPFFPMYLHLRQQSVLQATSTQIKPELDALGQYLRVPGGPVGRPFFRPFWNEQTNARQGWLNENLAGSYAPSSMRNVPLNVVSRGPGSTFSLQPHHWLLAREFLTYGERVPVLALAGFYLRNFNSAFLHLRRLAVRRSGTHSLRRSVITHPTSQTMRSMSYSTLNHSKQM